MNADFWIEKWAKNEIGFHQQDINSYLQTYWEYLNLKTDSRVLVPLCGKSRDMLWLCGQGHSVLGVEISPIAVNGFFNENDLIPQTSLQGPFQRWDANGLTILQGDFFQLSSLDVENVDGVFDRAALIAFPPELRQRYAQHLQEILPGKHRILLVILEYDQSLMAGPPFSVGEDELRLLYQQKYEITRLFEQDVLNENPQFRARGLNWLQEKVYILNSR